MGWISDERPVDGCVEREFVLDRNGGPIPGVVWAPADRRAERLLLLGHGATADKRVDYIEQVGKLATGFGMAAVAIDGPGHGDRRFGDIEEGLNWFPETWERAGGTEAIVADWAHTLDFMEAEFEPRPTGWWGLSMGTMVGLPVVVGDRRISLAVLGLMGLWGPNGKDLREAAPKMDRPVRFLVQWDDEIVPRDACLELFDALGTERKTLHANPGIHRNVPVAEVVSSIEYLDRYLS